MSSVRPSGSSGDPRHRRRVQTSIKDTLRELSIQLTLLNYTVSTKLSLKDVDLNCLDVIGREGPLSPSVLARRTGLHPATVTGIVDRLERGGWVVRERDPADRRGVLIRAQRERGSEIFKLFSGMNAAMDGICDGYDDEQLELLGGFLRRTVEAGRGATEELAAGG